MRRELAAGIIALTIIGGSATASAAHTATVKHCGTWTRSGALTNNTGQPVWLWDSDGAVPRQIVADGASVPFRETWPARVARHIDYLSESSLDYRDNGTPHPSVGWHVDGIPANVMRPASCHR